MQRSHIIKDQDWDYFKAFAFNPQNEKHIEFIHRKINEFNDSMRYSLACPGWLGVFAVVNGVTLFTTPYYISVAVAAMTGGLIYDSLKIVKANIQELYDIYCWAMPTGATPTPHQQSEYANALIVTLAPYLVDPLELYQWATKIYTKEIDVAVVARACPKFLEQLRKNSLFAISINEQTASSLTPENVNLTNIKKMLTGAIYGRGGLLRHTWPRLMTVKPKHDHTTHLEVNDTTIVAKFRHHVV